MVKDLVVAEDGTVTFTFLLGRDDPGSLAREVRKAVQGVQGVTGVRVNVTDASSAAEGAAPRQPAPRPGPGGVPPPPTPVELPHLGTVLAISSGKGGVGKSTVSANLAVALARAGHRVGLMDADIYGPNIPRMMGVDQKPEVRSGKIQPLEAHGVKLMSLALIVERDSPAIWRGPIIMKVIGQFVKDVDWGELDYFLVDLPPGTGDAQLSLAQTVHIRAAIIVTTPQEVAVGDSLRGAKMFERVGVPVLGVVENMSYFVCPHCGERTEIFLAGGVTRLAAELRRPPAKRARTSGGPPRWRTMPTRPRGSTRCSISRSRAPAPPLPARPMTSGSRPRWGIVPASATCTGIPGAPRRTARRCATPTPASSRSTRAAPTATWGWACTSTAWDARAPSPAWSRRSWDWGAATRSAGSPTCAGQPRREIWRGSRLAGCSRRPPGPRAAPGPAPPPAPRREPRHG